MAQPDELEALTKAFSGSSSKNHLSPSPLSHPLSLSLGSELYRDLKFQYKIMELQFQAICWQKPHIILVDPSYLLLLIFFFFGLILRLFMFLFLPQDMESMRSRWSLYWGIHTLRRGAPSGNLLLTSSRKMRGSSSVGTITGSSFSSMSSCVLR